MRGKCNLKFIPFPRCDELTTKIPQIVYKCQEYQKLSKQGKLRVKWIDYYMEKGKNVSLTCRYFGISRKTFYKWYKRYLNVGIGGLGDRRAGPHKKRQPEITQQEELRIKQLRKQYIRYGKEKLAVLYERQYGEKISAWKIYRVIKKYDLYWHPVKNEKLRRRRKLSDKKKRITELKNKKIDGFFFQFDTKVIWCYPTKRYIFSAVDKNTKIAFSRMYKNNSSYNARDFLLRLYCLVNGNFKYLQSDNGSEFLKYFHEACKNLNLEHYFSRVRTPKDNPEIERYNRTLEDEFLQMGNYIDDLNVFNPLLTEWLIEYNFNRPHQSLGYLTPMEFLSKKKEAKVLPIYPTYTIY